MADERRPGMPERLEVRLPPDAISATFDCSICGLWAMRVVTFPTADPGATFPTSVSRRPGWVVAESALGSNGLSIGELAEGRGPIDIEGAIRRADPAELNAIDRELVPLWCRDCGRVYCYDHWTVWMNLDPDDGGWYEDTRGRCPEGHERSSMTDGHGHLRRRPTGRRQRHPRITPSVPRPP